MSFKITENMLNNLDRVSDSGLKLNAQSKYKFDYLALDKISKNEKNFYAISDIESLAEDIYINGLQHNIVVRKISSQEESERYELVSGERRYSAFEKLYQQYGDDYKLIPAKIVELNDVDAEIQLIQSNAQARTLSPKEVFTQIERITALYEIKRLRGEAVSGKLRDNIANDLNMGSTQVGKYQSIQKNLDSVLIDKISKGDLSINSAEKLTKLPKEQQLDAYNNPKPFSPPQDNKNQLDIPSQTPKSMRPNKAQIFSSEDFKYSYTCPKCQVEMFSNSKINVRCEKCDVLFSIGEF